MTLRWIFLSRGICSSLKNFKRLPPFIRKHHNPQELMFKSSVNSTDQQMEALSRAGGQVRRTEEQLCLVCPGYKTRFVHIMPLAKWSPHDSPCSSFVLGQTAWRRTEECCDTSILRGTENSKALRNLRYVGQTRGLPVLPISPYRSVAAPQYSLPSVQLVTICTSIEWINCG